MRLYNCAVIYLVLYNNTDNLLSGSLPAVVVESGLLKDACHRRLLNLWRIYIALIRLFTICIWVIHTLITHAGINVFYIVINIWTAF